MIGPNLLLGLSIAGVVIPSILHIERIEKRRSRIGAIGRTRTCNLPVRSREFYPLNYDRTVDN